MRKLFLSLLLCTLVPDLSGEELKLDISLPSLNTGHALFSSLSEEQKKNLEVQLKSELSSAALGMGTQVRELIRTELMVPLFMEAVAGASSQLFSMPEPFDPGVVGWSLTLGARGTVQVDTWDLPDLQRRISKLSAADDYSWGAGALPLRVSLSGPLPVSWAGFRLEGSWMDISLEKAQGRIAGAGGTLTAGFPALRVTPLVRWIPLQGQVGAGWYSASVLTPVPLKASDLSVPPVSVQNSPVPLLIDVLLSPDIFGGVEASSLSFPVSVSTLATLAELVSLQLGAGAVFTRSSAGVLIRGKVGLELDPGFPDLFSSQGELSLQGTVQDYFAAPVSYHLFGSFTFSSGSFFLQVPWLWVPPYQVGTGVSLGLRL